MTKLLMCAPIHYGVDYTINPWMTDNVGKVDRGLALSQWTALYNELCKHAEILGITQDKNYPDMVFTANAGLVTNDKVILSNFLKPERQGEIPIFEEWFLKNSYTTVRQANTSFEGAGDFLSIAGEHDMVYYGHGIRSSIDSKKFLNDNLPVMKRNFHTLELIDPRFYHLDTCFCLLDKSLIMHYPGAFKREDLKSVFKTPYYIRSMEIKEEEALQFAANAIVIKKEIFMPKCDSVATSLERFGFNVHQFDMSEFIKAGGGPKCLVLEI